MVELVHENMYQVLHISDEDDETQQQTHKAQEQLPVTRRFDALACAHKADTNERFVVETGVDAIKFKSIRCKQNRKMPYHFFGECFHCMYVCHSQKYCPVKQCTHCKKFGHSHAVCRYKRPALNNLVFKPTTVQQVSQSDMPMPDTRMGEWMKTHQPCDQDAHKEAAHKDDHKDAV